MGTAKTSPRKTAATRRKAAAARVRDNQPVYVVLRSDDLARVRVLAEEDGRSLSGWLRRVIEEKLATIA